MAQVLGLVAAFVAGWLLALQWRRKKQASRVILAITDGKTLEVKEAQHADGLFKCAKNEIYPDVGAQRAYFGRDTYYLLAIEPTALATHRQLEKLRPAVVSGSLFRPGGDMVELAKWAAIAITFSLCWWISSQFGAMADSINRQRVVIEMMQETLSKPLIAAPVPAPAVPEAPGE